MEGVKYVSLNTLFFVKEMQASLASWWRLQVAVKGCEQVEQQFVADKFDKYLELLKPIIYRTDVLREIAYNNNYRIYTDVLTADQTKRLLTRYRQTTPLRDAWRGLELSITVGSPPEGVEVIDDPKKLPNSPSLRPEIYKMQVLEKPSNPERNFWNLTLPVDPCTIVSKVIYGKGIGKKDLGMPTANLENTSTINLLLADYPSAIYVTRVKLFDNWYRGAMNIGTNPQVEQSEERKLEVYICHNFEHNFYGEEIEVVLERLIRLELKFPSFGTTTGLLQIVFQMQCITISTLPALSLCDDCFGLLFMSEVFIKERLVELSLEQQELDRVDYRTQLLNSPRTHRYAEDVSEWKITTVRHSTDALPNTTRVDSLSRTVNQPRMALPRILNREYRGLFNSMNSSCDYIQQLVNSNTTEQYKSGQAVVVEGRFRLQLTPNKLNKINLKLSYESPRGRVRKIIHNRPNPLNSSLEIVRKIQRKRKQIDLINRLKNSEEFPIWGESNHSRQDHQLYIRQSREVQKLLEKYPFERKVANQLQQIQTRKRSYLNEQKQEKHERERKPRFRKSTKG